MRFFDYLVLALRNLWRQKLRTVLTIFAIVIGATSITIMLAAVFSLRGFMTKQFEQNGIFQQVAVSQQQDITWDDKGQGGNCSDCTKLTDDLVNKIKTVPHVAAVSRVVNVWQFQALLFGNQKYKLQQVTAHDENGVIISNVLAGRNLNDSDKAGVVTITADYANKFGYKGNYQALIGKQISIQSQGYYTGVGSDPVKAQQDMQSWFNTHPGQDGRDYSPAPVTLTATIVGITDSLDSGYTVRVPLEWARGMLLNQQFQVTKAAQDAANAACQKQRFQGSCPQPQPSLQVTDELAKEGYNSLIVKADQSSNAAAVAKQIKNQFKVGAADAETTIKQQLAVFNILGYVLGGIGGIALVVASVGVVNTMIMSILERTREIGVMRAVGARRSTISRLFTIEAALLGFWGGLIGLLIGYGVTLAANPIINKQLSGNGIKSSNIITLPLWLILGVIGLTTVIGILAGLYPARRAAKLDPVEALHYE